MIVHPSTGEVVTRENSLVDGSEWPQECWDELQFDLAWSDKGPSPAGNEGPYLKVPRWHEGVSHPDWNTVHRVYARPDGWEEVPG